MNNILEKIVDGVNSILEVEASPKSFPATIQRVVTIDGKEYSMQVEITLKEIKW